MTPNQPVRLYDTSGPYTDPSVHVDITQGLPQLRLKWILERGDVEYLSAPVHITASNGTMIWI